MFQTGKTPDDIVKEKGLKQITSEDAILSSVKDVFEKNAGQLGDYVGGNDRLHGFFVGQVMKLTGGTASPKAINEIIKREIEALRAKK